MGEIRESTEDWTDDEAAGLKCWKKTFRAPTTMAHFSECEVKGVLSPHLVWRIRCGEVLKSVWRCKKVWSLVWRKSVEKSLRACRQRGNVPERRRAEGRLTEQRCDDGHCNLLIYQHYNAPAPVFPLQTEAQRTGKGKINVSHAYI